MTMTTTGAPVTQAVGPPPFDRELAPLIEALVRLRGPDAYRPDNITEMRQPIPGVEDPTDAALSRDGAYRVEERAVPGQIVVGGASAGGSLAPAVALLARDRNGPAVLAQLLMCPMLDDRNDSPSARQMRGLGIWDASSNATGWSALLGEGVRGGPDVSLYAAPARATDFAGLPPAFIDVGTAETFRDEDVAYASRIWQAGGEAEQQVWSGGFHGFEVVAPDAAISQDATAARAAWLRRQLGR